MYFLKVVGIGMAVCVIGVFLLIRFSGKGDPFDQE